MRNRILSIALLMTIFAFVLVSCKKEKMDPPKNDRQTSAKTTTHSDSNYGNSSGGESGSSDSGHRGGCGRDDN